MAMSRFNQAGASLMAVALLGFGGVALAQSQPADKGPYVLDSSRAIWRNSVGHCWRTGYWTPSAATCECDKDILPKEKCEPPKPAPAAKKQDTVPATPLIPPMGPDKPAFEKVTLQAETLFDFDKAVIRPDGMKTLDEQVVAKMKEYPQVEVVLVTGHADRIGSEAYNQALSERRAAAVKNYLVSKGVESGRIETAAKGESEPVVDCKHVKGAESGKNKKLVECLQPNRRVVVEVKVQKPAK